jgi:hypothetical protein
MKLFRNLRLRWHDYMLKKKIEGLSIKRASIRFEKSKRIGILFDATNLDNRVFVENYVQLLRKAEKRVDIMAFVDDEQEHDNLPFKYFNTKNLSWYEHPNTSEVEGFINTPFDILLSIHLHSVKSLEYISSLSHASMRVGKYDKSKIDCYDLMIDNAQNDNLQHFIQQVDKHLKIMG